jgi:hypothetical protein
VTRNRGQSPRDKGYGSVGGFSCLKQGTTEYTENTEERHNRAGIRFRVFHLFRG